MPVLATRLVEQWRATTQAKGDDQRAHQADTTGEEEFANVVHTAQEHAVSPPDQYCSGHLPFHAVKQIWLL